VQVSGVDCTRVTPLAPATELSVDLEAALARGEMRVHYLPTVGLADGLVTGVEALARWQRDDRVLATQEFLDLAEKTGQIVEIGRWVMERACREVALWNAQHRDRTPLRLAVNVSLRQLTEPGAVAIVESVLREAAFDPTLLTLELSEDALHALGHAAGPTLHAFQELGVRLSVDDFGTGASSLVALQRYQLDEIKIDRSFVAQMDEDADAAAIVRGVTRLAQSLRLRTVAEGVERPGQEQMLRALQCDAAQGWLYARPTEDLDGAVTAATAAAVSSLHRKPAEHAELWEGMPTPLTVTRFVETVFDTAPIGMALIDETGRHIAANPAAADLLGFPAVELLEKTCWEMVHAEDLHADLRGMDELLAGERSSYTVEERIVGTDGTSRWVEVTVCGVPGDHQANDAPPRLLRQVRSIEGTKRAEEVATVLRSVIAASPEALIIADPSGCCTDWNPAAERLFGWTKEQMLGARMTRLVDDATQLPMARVLGEAATGRPVRWADASWLTASGEPCAVDVTVGPIIDGTGAMVGLVALARDVSEQRQAAIALAQTHEALSLHAAELAAANVRLATFAGTLAHDMAQPLAAADGFLRLLDRQAGDGLDDEQQSWLAGALRGTQRLRQAVDALYRNATADELQLAPVDLASVVDELVPTLLHELGDAELVVEALPVVSADRGFVTQVLANLVQNAGRYRDDERPLVITLGAARDEASWVVAVSDSGKGISTDELEGVFVAGARGRSAAGTDGTGTGLATVRTLMERMGGEVWAEPVPGGGVRMCLRFAPAD
jgi:PAS domain S-box-containing protein